MNLSKKNLNENISRKTGASIEDSSKMLESLLSIIKKNTRSKNVKLASFGSFQYKKTLERQGRNPKTKELYIIPVARKLFFKASNTIKAAINWTIFIKS